MPRSPDQSFCSGHAIARNVGRHFLFRIRRASETLLCGNFAKLLVTLLRSAAFYFIAVELAQFVPTANAHENRTVQREIVSDAPMATNKPLRPVWIVATKISI